MSAVLLSRQEQRPIFDQAFRIFWRDPKLAERMMSLLLPHAHGRAPKPSSSRVQRLTDALFAERKSRKRKLELEARLTFSARGALAHGLRHHVGGRAGRGEEDARRAAAAFADDQDAKEKNLAKESD